MQQVSDEVQMRGVAVTDEEPGRIGDVAWQRLALMAEQPIDQKAIVSIKR